MCYANLPKFMPTKLIVGFSDLQNNRTDRPRGENRSHYNTADAQ
jgi:hypothetical protein